MPRRTLVAISFGLLLAQTGCIAFPFVTPPLALSLGGGVRRGLPESLAESPGLFRLDVGARPLQLIEAWEMRRADVGVGYALTMGGGPTLHCGFAEGIVYPLVGPVARMGIHMQPRVLFHAASEAPPTFGMAVRLSGEVRAFTSKPFADISGRGGAIGYAHGEGGMSLYLEGAYERVYDRPTLVLGAGLSFRIPATAGIAIASFL